VLGVRSKMWIRCESKLDCDRTSHKPSTDPTCLSLFRKEIKLGEHI
jgi:hypothetical protein